MDIENEDLVKEDASVSFEIKMNYVQDDGRSIAVVPTLYRAVKKDAVLDNIKSTYVTSNTGIDFSQISSDTNGKGVYTIATTMNEEYPISYYRGDVDNNNVLFGGFCWLIVRTTEKGGVKLIYNGEPDSMGVCPSSGSSIQTTSNLDNYEIVPVGGIRYSIESTYFNDTYNSSSTPADVGYMYGTRYLSSSAEMVVDDGAVEQELSSESKDLNIVYGNDVSYDTTTGLYTLVTTTTSKLSEWQTNYEKIMGANGYHYTCFSEENTCSEVFYAHTHVDTDYDGTLEDGEIGTLYFIILQNGKKIENALEEMFENTTDSEVKKAIDTWYSENMTSYTEYLEDAIWCNDRSISEYAGWKKNGNAIYSENKLVIFSPAERISITGKPSLSCSNKRDSFTVDESETGNGKLDYPVGMITGDEVMYAGGTSTSNESYYLYNGDYYWTLSPGNFHYDYVRGTNVYSDGRVSHFGLDFPFPARPSVSLEPGTIYLSGDGTKEKPYQVGETIESEA